MSAPSRKLLAHIATVALLISAAYFAVHWSPLRDGAPMRDFVAPYAGARCLWAGCNPYDPRDVAQEFARAGGGENDHPLWSWPPPVYPPSSLVVLLPVSLFHYHAGRDVWRCLDDALLTCGL